MARAFSRVAGKDYPEHGIKKGDLYYYWSVGFRGRKQMSKTPPKQSQLTGSKMSAAYAAQETAQESIGNATTPEEIKDALEAAADEIEAVADEYQEAADATTGNGNRVPNADEMEEKASGLRDWAESLRTSASEIENMEVSEYVDDSIAVSDLPEELVETTDGERARKEVEDFDDLTDAEKDAMMQAARDTADENMDCPL
jgi:hypothetical protein